MSYLHIWQVFSTSRAISRVHTNNMTVTLRSLDRSLDWYMPRRQRLFCAPAVGAHTSPLAPLSTQPQSLRPCARRSHLILGAPFHASPKPETMRWWALTEALGPVWRPETRSCSCQFLARANLPTSSRLSRDRAHHDARTAPRHLFTRCITRSATLQPPACAVVRAPPAARAVLSVDAGIFASHVRPPLAGSPACNIPPQKPAPIA